MVGGDALGVLTYLADLENVGNAGEKLGVDAETAVERVTGACDQALSKFSVRWLDNRYTGRTYRDLSWPNLCSIIFSSPYPLISFLILSSSGQAIVTFGTSERPFAAGWAWKGA